MKFPQPSPEDIKIFEKVFNVTMQRLNIPTDPRAELSLTETGKASIVKAVNQAFIAQMVSAAIVYGLDADEVIECFSATIDMLHLTSSELKRKYGK